MKISLNKNRKLLQTIMALAFTGAIMFYYYGWYIPQNENFALAQKFRLLKQTGSNLTEKIKSYNQLADRYASSKDFDLNSKTVVLNKINERIATDGQAFDNVVDANKKSKIKDKGDSYLITDEDNPENFIFIGSDNKKSHNTFNILNKDKFLSSLRHNKTMDGFFLVADKTIVFDATDLGLSKANFIHNTKLDSVSHHSFTTRTTIAGVNYRIFMIPLEVYLDDQQIIIGGVVKEDAIQSEIRVVKPYVLITVLFLLLFSLLLMPFFKIWVMGKKDRLNFSDVAAVYFSSFLLIAVVCLWFIRYSDLFCPTDNSNDNLIQQLNTNLTNEFEEAETLLDSLNKDLLLFNATDSVSRPHLNIRDNLKLIFWVDSTGKLLNNGTIVDNYYRKQMVPEANLSDRNYFQELNPSKKHPGDRAAIDPIISRADEKFEFVLAQRSPLNEPFLFGISILPRTFYRQVLPMGVQMAIVRKDGLVVMHTDSTKNMNENILLELQYPTQLEASIKFNTTERFSSRYFNKEYDIVSAPMKDYPFFIVKMTDKSYKQGVDSKILLFTTSLVFAILLVVFLLSLYLNWSRNRIYIRKNANAGLSAIYPQKVYQNRYALLGSINLLFIFLTALWFLVTSFDPGWLFINFIVWLFAVLFSWAIMGFTFSMNWFNKVEEIAVLRLINEESWFYRRYQKLFQPGGGYVRKYSFMIFSNMFLMSFMLVLLFYCTSFNYYTNILRQYALYDFSKNWLERESYDPQFGNTGKFVMGGNYTITEINDKDWANIQEPKNDSIRVFTFFNDYTSYFSTGNFHFEHHAPLDSLKFITLKRDNVSIALYDRIKVTDEDEQYIIPHDKRFYKKWFYSLLAISLLIVSLIVHNVIKTFFGTRFPEVELDDISKLEKLLPLTTEFKYIFIQGLTGGNKLGFIRNYLLETLKLKDKTICEIELLEIPDQGEYAIELLRKKWDDYIEGCLANFESKIYIIKHFEYNFQDHHTNRMKLNLMEKLAGKKVIIVSSIEPTGFLHSLEESGYMNNDNSKAVLDDITRWNVLLGKYINIIFPIDKIDDRNIMPDTELPSMITKELGASVFLNRIRPVFNDNDVFKRDLKKLNAAEGDSAIINLHISVTHYYRDIWSSLTPEEKVMIYDLAEEGLLNTANYLALYGLIKKGLIVRKAKVFYLMNESFRHYVLSTITKEEIGKAENKINENSMWKDFQVPLIVAIAAMVWFVLYANQDQFGVIFPIITALAAGLPTLIKLFSYFIPGAAKVGP